MSLKAFRACAISLGVAAFSGIPAMSALAYSAPAYVQNLLPSGATAGTTETFSLAGHRYAVVTTQSTAQDARPWIIIGEQSQAGWQPIFATQTLPAWRAQEILIGPRTRAQVALSVSFVVDAATALESNVYTVVVQDQRARVASILPDVINAAKPRVTDRQIEVDALNLQATGAFDGNKWVTRFTPLRTLLSHSSQPVYFVLDRGTNQGSGTIRLIGASAISLRAGQSISFVPLNEAAATQLLGAAGNLGTNQGITVFTNGGGAAPLRFFQAAQVMTNSYSFSSSGTYSFGIVPPQFTAMSPNSQVATLTVKVSKH